MFDALVSYGGVNGIFGTKLISNFFLSAFPTNTQLKQFQEYVSDREFRPFVLTRSIVDRSVSVYFAARSALWHLRSAADVVAAHSSIPYDEDKLLALVRHTQKEEDSLNAFLDTWGVERCELDYDVVTSAPTDELLRVRSFLGMVDGPEGISIDQAKTPQKISDQSERMQEFSARLGDALKRKRSLAK